MQTHVQSTYSDVITSKKEKGNKEDKKGDVYLRFVFFGAWSCRCQDLISFFFMVTFSYVWIGVVVVDVQSAHTNTPSASWELIVV